MNNVTNNSNDKKMLKEYLDKFSTEQLMEYFDIVAKYSFEYNIFMSVRGLWCLLNELNCEVRKIDPSIPVVGKKDNTNILADNPFYFFDYLTKELIVDMLFKHIDYHVIMAENTAETLYNCGRDAAVQYPKMVLAIRAQFGSDFEVLM